MSVADDDLEADRASDDTAREAAAKPGGLINRRLTVDPKLLEFLVCPLTKTPLTYDAERQELISRVARLAYPIVDGMPVMVVAEARQLEGDDPLLRR